MARFTLGTTGAASINAGVGSIFKALAQAPYLRQQAEQQAGWRAAQAYNAESSGDKNAAQAEAERYTTGQRQAIDDLLAKDPAMEPFRRAQLTAFKFAGPEYMERFSNAGETEQKIQAISDIQKNPALATATGQAYAATSGKMPFSDVGSTGRVLNALTGQGSILESTLSKLYDDKTISETGENNAQAANARAAAEQHRASATKTGLEADALRDADTTGPLSGKPLTNAQRRANTDVEQARKFINGVPKSRIRAVMSKSEFDLTPADKDLLARIKKARTAKYGEATVPDHLNEALGLDSAIVGSLVEQLSTPKTTPTMFGLGEDRPMTEAETLASIKKTLPASEQGALDDYIAAARAKMGQTPAAGAPAGAPTGKALSKMPAGAKYIGTSKGKPVYQTPDGKRYIVG